MSKIIKSPPEKPYYMVQTKEGKQYSICTCHKTNTPPFCDGSHWGTDYSPKEFRAAEDKNICFCWCGRTQDSPLCDGSHKQ